MTFQLGSQKACTKLVPVGEKRPEQKKQTEKRPTKKNKTAFKEKEEQVRQCVAFWVSDNAAAA